MFENLKILKILKKCIKKSKKKINQSYIWKVHRLYYNSNQ
jgi:hypothetical protein